MSSIGPTFSGGSSPHTWGTQFLGLLWESIDRFIPTHVGNTRSTPARAWGSSVHPHTRGEHEVNSGKGMGFLGSSPHTWGTRYVKVCFVVDPRFIPTHVGNTSALCLLHPRSPVHPHTRGEHPLARVVKNGNPGSSPHTWGTQWRILVTLGF